MQEHSEKEYKELADRLSSMGEQNSNVGSTWSGWGGWGVTSLLTSGVSQLTSHVSQVRLKILVLNRNFSIQNFIYYPYFRG